MRLTILSENYTPFSLKLRGQQGFSVLIENDGGQFLYDTSQVQLEDVKGYLKELIREDGVELFAPAHCTGIHTIIDFYTEFKDITKPAFCGSVFEI